MKDVIGIESPMERDEKFEKERKHGKPKNSKIEREKLVVGGEKREEGSVHPMKTV